ncbi:MAG: GTPase ObgE [Planctomycetes bacterium]|jgi:GTP-binding protein|nr:GTPase ObgE [Planctomycetota bacterium]MBT5100762.1 GTPase ObgE [Planctomycetota bacterium]MBT7012138.1 GTPase ObgE [Planctomycetota bacterium]
MFRDEAIVSVTAGSGGPGCSSMRREKYVIQGGPDGGDGGAGGHIVFRAIPHENSLFRIARMRLIRAENGQPGGPRNRTGRGGSSTIIDLPVGTQIRDAEFGNLLADLAKLGDEVVIAEGGKGGRGNARFTSATQQAPTHSEEGLEGERRDLRLELKLVADIGLLGLPNAGKSTFLRRVTAARPKVAEYPFTTLDPGLGIMETGGDPPTLIIADIPGIIEGASDGKGLGFQFLRHVERTRALLHLVDVSLPDEDPVTQWRIIRDELASYGEGLEERDTLLVATKVESEESEKRAQALFEAAGLTDGLMISSVTGRGLEALRHRLFALTYPKVSDF